MRQVLLFSLLLPAGMAGAQLLPSGGSAAAAVVGHGLQVLTMVALAFMIHVSYEFEPDKTNRRQYGWDVATAASAGLSPRQRPTPSRGQVGKWIC